MTALLHDRCDVFPRSGWMRTQIRIGCQGFLIALLLLLVAAPARAQSWSRGLQDFPISTSECMQRAALGLQAEGYTIGGRGDSYIGGIKGMHTAVVMCDAGPGGKTLANIVVVSGGASDGGVPGGERVRLHQRMQNTASGGGIGTWRSAGIGDCSGYDTGSTQGKNPDPGRCNASTAGLTAICFGTWCTYKDIKTDSCTGGSNPGNMYTCNLSSSQGGQELARQVADRDVAAPPSAAMPANLRPPPLRTLAAISRSRSVSRQSGLPWPAASPPRPPRKVLRPTRYRTRRETTTCRGSAFKPQKPRLQRRVARSPTAWRRGTACPASTTSRSMSLTKRSTARSRFWNRAGRPLTAARSRRSRTSR